MLINVQFLRLVAAMLVALFHTGAHVRATTDQPGWLFETTAVTGFAGVDLFFVISGFIMAWTTREATGLVEASDFAKRRAARIYSGFWPFVLLTWALFAWLDSPVLERVQWLRSTLLWPTYLQHLLIAVSWTLIFEMVFYLLYAILIATTRRHRERVIWLIGVLLLIWVLVAQFLRRAYDPDQLGGMSVYEAYLLNPLMFEFLAGALLAGYLHRNPSGRAWTWLLIGVASFLAAGWLNARYFQGHLDYGFYNLWRVLAFGPASIFIVAGLVRLEQRDIKAPLQLSLLGGGASYAFYLCHTQWLHLSYELGFRNLLRGLAPWLIQLSFLGLVILILLYSVLHWRWVERPLHRLFRRVLRA